MTHVLVGPHESGDVWRLYDNTGTKVAGCAEEPEEWQCIESVGDAMVDFSDTTTIYKFVAEVYDKFLVKRLPGNEPWNGGPPLP